MASDTSETSLSTSPTSSLDLPSNQTTQASSATGKSNREPEYVFAWDGTSVSLVSEYADGTPEERAKHLSKFEEFLRCAHEADAESKTSLWRLECRRRRVHMMDYFFYDTESRCFRTKEQLLREIQAENEGSDDETKKAQDMKRKASLRHAHQKKLQKEMERLNSSITYSRPVLRSLAPPEPEAKRGKRVIPDARGIAELESLIASAKSILVVVGAGVSTAAGLPDFRSKSTGMYAQLSGKDMPPEVLFHVDSFLEDPVSFYQFASETFLPLVEKVRPTVTHRFIHKLASSRKLLRCYTQNVDGLERLAGLEEKFIVECHGTLRSARCLKCGKKRSEPYWWRTQSTANKGVPECDKKGCKGDLRPDMTFFGEQVPGRVDQRLSWDVDKCDMVLVMGTSLSVQPVSEILTTVPKKIPRAWVNVADPPNGFHFKVSLRSSCDDVAEQIMRVLK